MSDFLGVALYVAIALVGYASTVVASIWTWRYLRRRGVATLPAVLILVVATVLILGILWIVFDVWWAISAAVKLIRPLKRRQLDPAPRPRG